ncbi:MAG: hypothetical protein JXR97_14105, partial [Planctomycetes bacterium]|nr:hypothetical protein [Planctomycetota bacterium]
KGFTGWEKPTKKFRLATAKEVEMICPPPSRKWDEKKLPCDPIRILEDGEIVPEVEAIFICELSTIVRRYVFDKKTGGLEVRDRVMYAHSDMMLKMEIPLADKPKDTIAEAIYSAVTRTPDREIEERVNQRWTTVRTAEGSALSVLGPFGAHSLTDKAFYVTVMRSPAFASCNIRRTDNTWNVDRATRRHDQGEHEITWRLNFAKSFNEKEVSQASQMLLEPAVWQIFYPSGRKEDKFALSSLENCVTVDSPTVQIVALKKAEKSNAMIVRVQDVSGRTQTTTLRIKGSKGVCKFEIGGYNLKTFAVTKKGAALNFKEVNLVEGL